MKDTGIVRRIDELGRIVIPKEMRKQLLIKEGESISFSIDDGKIVLSKYSYLSHMSSSVQRMLEVLYKKYGNVFMFSDLNEVIVVSSNGVAQYQRMKLDPEVKRMIRMKQVISDYEMRFHNQYRRICIIPLLFELNAIGAIIVIADKTPFIRMSKEVLSFVREVIEQEIEECV